MKKPKPEDYPSHSISIEDGVSCSELSFADHLKYTYAKNDYYKQRGDAAIALLIKVKPLVSPYDKACSCSRCDVFNKIDALLGDEQ